MDQHESFGETMIEVGDLVRVKTSEQGVKGNVFLVLKESRRGALRWVRSGGLESRRLVLCAQGSKKVLLYIDSLEKL